MTDLLINGILIEMKPHLTKKQRIKLKEVLEVNINPKELSEQEEKNQREKNEEKLTLFLSTKKLEGCSPDTLNRYKIDIFKMLIVVNKDICTITTQDIRNYLSQYQDERKIGKVTLDNMRRYFSSFFTWLETEDHIIKNPMRKIKHIKQEQLIKHPYSDEELEIIRQGAKTNRDLAIIEVLYSTGVRVSELVNINVSDVKMFEREIIVYGKGEKEREVYLSEKAMYYLKKYLEERTDNNPALFVHHNKNKQRLKKGGTEMMLKKIGIKENILKVHPHRFRRTIVCRAVRMNTSLPIIQKMLGHAKIETTMIYCNVEKEDLKYAHRRFAA